MERHPDFISSRKLPKAVTGFERLADLLGGALGVCGGLALLGVGAFVVEQSELTDTSAFKTTHCFPTPEEAARMAAELRQPEVIELPKSQPGIIIPNEEQEAFR